MISKDRRIKFMRKVENLVASKLNSNLKNGYVSADDQIDHLNGRYNIHELLGSGGFGAVFSASIKKDYTPLAIKVIKREAVHSWSKVGSQKVPSEIEMLKRCKNISGVVNLSEWYSLPDYYILIMSRPDSCMNLRQLTEKYEKLNEDMARFLFKQVVTTVKSCMKNDVVHKDIKMENIVIDMETGRTILVDFGAATSKNVKTKEIQGTIGYVPPEWFLYEMYLDEPASVWSLGILLFSMLKGHLPFGSEFEICSLRIESMISILDLTPSARSLVENCLRFDFSSRFSFDQILESNWLSEPTLEWDNLVPIE